MDKTAFKAISKFKPKRKIEDDDSSDDSIKIESKTQLPAMNSKNRKSIKSKVILPDEDDNIDISKINK